ncbi:MAG TPA: hypothetical protein DDY78_00845 [Planctomycetales bacterium]|jgi:uncharacterized protein YPO0396|nr:hypothetical protein [Planctomycetales bacterium]
MPSRTLEDKVEELTKLEAAHGQQLQGLQEALIRAAAERSDAIRSIGELKIAVVRLEHQVGELTQWKAEIGSLADLKTDLTILRRDVDKLEKTKEEWSRRVWALAGPILGAAVGWALGYFSRR